MKKGRTNAVIYVRIKALRAAGIKGGKGSVSARLPKL